MKKVLPILMVSVSLGLLGCTTTKGEGGNKAEKKESKAESRKCLRTGSRLKRAC
ncbi:hypothetical protein [Alteromonas sp. ASW11-130]|uniref:hypothetical protein n=1 Tax=Alteromonas sp. ASW11-130 TaxID=3015775 RepID=UPI00224230F4|nr:hypothetical protein [Alteromonas sp. ASW11-130]MCW8091000.1 hypothetical protein [Alteromonas sp. ASW11-130]